MPNYVFDTGYLDDECKHAIYPAIACTICNPKAAPEIAKEDGKTMTAIFDGQCPDCNLPIYAGSSTIKKRRGKWLHKQCADFLDRNR